MAAKRTLDGFFKTSTNKKPRIQEQPMIQSEASLEASNHPTYPWPVPYYAPEIIAELEDLRQKTGKEINNQPDLDLVYYQPFVPSSIAQDLFNFLRSHLFFYRVKYTIKRFGKETLINTPRYTTVFGIDETSRFITDPPSIVEAAEKSKTVPKTKYKCQPRAIPECLDLLRRVAEEATGCKYNFTLVNYYATGEDSISYHSDDERFLGPDPAIASFTLGAKRDFLMKHKPVPPKDGNMTVPEADPIKLSLGSGDMLLMKGPTQANWLHSIPKRKNIEAEKGRINITLRKAVVPGGTENYYRYNVGEGEVYKWDPEKRKMMPWTASRS